MYIVPLLVVLWYKAVCTMSLRKSKETNPKYIKNVVVLPDVRSTYNVGSIFRTCDGAGIYKVYLSGYTPTPVDIFNRPRKDIAKTALGAEQVVLWEYKKSVSELLKKLKKEGYVLVAVEQDKRSVSYNVLFKSKKIKNTPKAIIFGNETEGLPKRIINLCDYVVDIPMRGEKESLNVSVSAGIILYSL